MLYQSNPRDKAMCRICEGTEQLFTGERNIIGICENCLRKLSVKETDNIGICGFTDYSNKCDNHIHFTHKGMFDFNVGICAKHVAEWLKWFAEQKAKKEVVKVASKPKPTFVQASLF